MKKPLIILIIFSSCTTPQSRSNEYYETVVGHIVQTVISDDYIEFLYGYGIWGITYRSGI